MVAVETARLIGRARGADRIHEHGPEAHAARHAAFRGCARNDMAGLADFTTGSAMPTTPTHGVSIQSIRSPVSCRVIAASPPNRDHCSHDAEEEIRGVIAIR